MPSPAIAAGISGITSLVGGLFGNSANRKEANRNREFQAQQSNTAHRREVIDLKAAGLNPILSARLGGSSSSPGSIIPMQDPTKGVPGAIHSALSASKVKSEIASIESATALNAEKINTEQTTQDLAKANTGLSTANTGLTSAKTVLDQERTRTQAQLTAQEKTRVLTAFATLGKTRMESIQAEAAADKAIQQGIIDQSEVGALLAWLARAKELGVGLDTVMSLLRRRKPGAKLPHIPNASNGFKPFPGKSSKPAGTFEDLFKKKFE